MNLAIFKTACDAAYDIGIPLISDLQYDNLFGESATIGRTGYADDITHAFPMWSLQKYYPEDGDTPLPLTQCIKTPKLDGNAVCLVYINNVFVRAETRGDGLIGKDITEKMRYLVPKEYVSYVSLAQIMGEVVASAVVDNSRNQVAGSLGLKDPKDFETKCQELGTKFIAYGVAEALNSTYTEDLEDLHNQGFNTVFDDCSEFPTDGTVYRLDNNKQYLDAGYTSKHPKGAFAWKEKQKAVVTQLLDVVWQVGKSGKVTPIAILEPVIIGEATVTRATLNNMAFIDALNLEIGCYVNIIRAGEIIPEIVSRNYLENNS